VYLILLESHNKAINEANNINSERGQRTGGEFTIFSSISILSQQNVSHISFLYGAHEGPWYNDIFLNWRLATLNWRFATFNWRSPLSTGDSPLATSHGDCYCPKRLPAHYVQYGFHRFHDVGFSVSYMLLLTFLQSSFALVYSSGSTKYWSEPRWTHFNLLSPWIQSR